MKEDNFLKKKKGIVNLLLLLIAILTIGGCAIKIENLDIMLPSSDKIPLRVGLYMSPEFRNYIYSKQGAKFHIGEGLSIGAEKALKQVFNEVVIINNKSDISNQNIKAVISPEILDVDLSISYNDVIYFFRTSCRWTISGADSKVYYNDTITGVGKHNSFASGTTRAKKALTNAIENHYFKFIEQMLSSKWWENIK